MPLVAHIMDVGCGNMALIVLGDGSVCCYDCNITAEGEESVLSYLDAVIGEGTGIDVFINSHRDADHMRGIKSLHSSHPIAEIWETGVPGTTTDSPEYEGYMDLRRNVATSVIDARKYWNRGGAKLRCMNSHWDDYAESNDQSIVMKIEFKGASLMLAGDTSYRPWKEKILTCYEDADLQSSILLASHHGSITFFDDPSDTQNYYTAHIKKIKPAMTLVSVGPNVHDLPDEKALKLYDTYSTGSDKGNKVFTTEEKGTMKLTLHDNGGWNLLVNQ